MTAAAASTSPADDLPGRGRARRPRGARRRSPAARRTPARDRPGQADQHDRGRASGAGRPRRARPARRRSSAPSSRAADTQVEQDQRVEHGQASSARSRCRCRQLGREPADPRRPPARRRRAARSPRRARRRCRPTPRGAASACRAARLPLGVPRAAGSMAATDRRVAEARRRVAVRVVAGALQQPVGRVAVDAGAHQRRPDRERRTPRRRRPPQPGRLRVVQPDVLDHRAATAPTRRHAASRTAPRPPAAGTAARRVLQPEPGGERAGGLRAARPGRRPRPGSPRRRNRPGAKDSDGRSRTARRATSRPCRAFSARSFIAVWRSWVTEIIER